MDPELIHNDALDTESIWRQPDEEFFIPNDIRQTAALQQAQDDLAEATPWSDEETPAAVIITDDDADGLGASLIIEQVYDIAVTIPAGPHGVLDVQDAIDCLLTHGDETLDVWVADIRLDAAPDSDVVSALRALTSRNTVRWFDHHDWDMETKAAVALLVDTLVIDDGTDVPKVDERCAAQLVCDHVQDQGHDVPDPICEAIHVTGVYDCWKKDDNDNFLDVRAKDLADYADIATGDQYKSAVTEYGADIAADDDIRIELNNHRTLMADLDALAIEETDYYVLHTETGKMPRVSEFNIDRLREEGPRDPDQELIIAITYGRCDTNTVADELNDLSDAAAIVKPDGRVSFRSRGEFDDCSSVAARFDGGGHGQAAGAHVAEGDRGIDLDSMVAYGEHWASNGHDARSAVRKAFKDVLVSSSHD